ncbi:MULTISPECIES: FAD-dependent monooxygenase [unclassified Streptomyces]|uniref:FAD-dependent monooxygenase n=1 Tax=unclassified Streptomyces TaxID=2593676 RepID=UPI0009394D27|nr:FAD-dependent monooxygenase [Streptomyces sp. CB02058]OKI97615.1 monooxygenase [Streptomyces sp. CB02058]
MTDVLIVGAGPTGLTLACDLARRGIAVRIVDRSPEYPRSSRSKGPNPRSLEVLEDLGVIGAVLESSAEPPVMRKYRDGEPVADTDPYAGSSPAPDAPYDRGRLIAQWRLEEILRDRLAEHGAAVETGTEVVGLTDDGTSVTVAFADGSRTEARYVVGCDGAHSRVRKLLGVPFDGETDEEQVMVCGDVEITPGVLDRGVWHQWFDPDGAVMLCPIPGTRSGWWFQSGPERDSGGRPLAPTEEGFRRLFARHTRLPAAHLTGATLLSTYRVNVRMADRYRVGRVLLAGDAAHVHAIAGGLGMNTGIQDSFNLGWKLAQVVRRRAGAELLDTYEEERLPVAAWTLDITSERLRATLEAITKPGGGLDSAVTPSMSGLDRGYRWSSLARPGGGDGLRSGDRAPDAPCHDAVTGEPTRLFRIFAGPHITVLGFGAGTGPALRAAASAHGDAVRTCLVHGPGTPAAGTAEAGPPALHDRQGLARTAYGVRGDGIVVVRPDNHVGLIAEAGDERAVREYLAALDGAREPGRVEWAGMVDGTRKG